MRIRIRQAVVSDVWNFEGDEAVGVTRIFRPGEVFSLGEDSEVDADTSVLDLIGLGVAELPNSAWEYDVTGPIFRFDPAYFSEN